MIEAFARVDQNLRVGLLRSVGECAPRLDLHARIIELSSLDEEPAEECPRHDAGQARPSKALVLDTLLRKRLYDLPMQGDCVIEPALPMLSVRERVLPEDLQR